MLLLLFEPAVDHTYNTITSKNAFNQRFLVIQILKPTKHKVRGAPIIQELYCDNIDVKRFLVDNYFIRFVFKFSEGL